MKKIFAGIMPAIVTPLKEDNRTVNVDVMGQLVERHLADGADGFYLLGGTGEGLVVDREQREILCEATVKQVAGRKPIINHIAAMNLEETVELAKHAEKAGCDAISSVPPLFFFHDAEDLYNYYKKLAESVTIPVIMYYHPSAGAHMSAELVARICEIDNMTGVKWSVNNYYEMMRLKDMTQGDVNIINGPDEMLLMGLSAGADAGIGSTYNLMLPQYKAIYKAFKAGDIDTARRLQMQVNRVVKVVVSHETIPAVKYGVNMMGYDVGVATFPMRQIPAGSCPALEAELKEAGWPFR